MNSNLNSHFTAGYLHVEDMGQYLLVGLADRQFDTSDYIIFQRAHQFDGQDVRLGLDNVHVERNDQGFSGYGGMRWVTLFHDCLRVDFDDAGTRNMAGLSSMEVIFAFPGDRFQTLRKGLQQCFAGFDCFRDQTQTG